MAKERKVAVDLTYRDIGMIVCHLEQSARDGWHYGNRTHFCNRRDKLIELLESKLSGPITRSNNSPPTHDS